LPFWEASLPQAGTFGFIFIKPYYLYEAIGCWLLVSNNIFLFTNIAIGSRNASPGQHSGVSADKKLKAES